MLSNLPLQSIMLKATPWEIPLTMRFNSPDSIYNTIILPIEHEENNSYQS